jgi:hypothetical protein
VSDSTEYCQFDNQFLASVRHDGVPVKWLKSIRRHRISEELKPSQLFGPRMSNPVTKRTECDRSSNDWVYFLIVQANGFGIFTSCCPFRTAISFLSSLTFVQSFMCSAGHCVVKSPTSWTKSAASRAQFYDNPRITLLHFLFKRCN